MSGDCPAFKLSEDDVLKFLACSTHIGSNNVDFQMEQYVWKRKQDGAYIIHLGRTWEKVVLAARAIAAIENPADVCIISSRPWGQRAILKFAVHIGATAIAGRFTPGTFTNQIQRAFKEPRLLIVTDPRSDHQAIREASYVNIPVIALCNTDSPLRFVDIAIPCNNKGQKSIGLMWWMLAREVLLIQGKISRTTGFEIDGNEIMPDLYFYRDPDEAEKEAEEVRDKRPGEEEPWTAPVAEDWPDQTIGGGLTGAAAAPATIGDPAEFKMQAPVIADWAAETQQWSQQTQQQDQWGGGGAATQW